MKITLKKKSPVFNPIELTITIENQNELDSLKCLSCYSNKIPDYLKRMDIIKSDSEKHNLSKTMEDLYKSISEL